MGKVIDFIIGILATFWEYFVIAIVSAAIVISTNAFQTNIENINYLVIFGITVSIALWTFLGINKSLPAIEKDKLALHSNIMLLATIMFIVGVCAWNLQLIPLSTTASGIVTQIYPFIIEFGKYLSLLAIVIFLGSLVKSFFILTMETLVSYSKLRKKEQKKPRSKSKKKNQLNGQR